MPCTLLNRNLMRPRYNRSLVCSPCWFYLCLLEGYCIISSWLQRLKLDCIEINMSTLKNYVWGLDASAEVILSSFFLNLIFEKMSRMEYMKLISTCICLSWLSCNYLTTVSSDVSSECKCWETLWSLPKQYHRHCATWQLACRNHQPRVTINRRIFSSSNYERFF